jgi:aspartate-semialdehyde dehydrogenase
VKSLLRDRGIPYQKISLLSSLDEEKGALTDVGEEPAVVQGISDEELEGLDLVFFCGDGALNRRWIEKREDLGFIAIDLSQPPSGVDGIPIVAGVNDDDIPNRTSAVISPHPIATPLAILLSRLAEVISIELCVATAVQPASELGQAGIDELMQQTVSVFSVSSVPKAVFQRQLAFNLFPADEAARDAAVVLAQVKSITGFASLALSIVQGTLFHGHSFSVFLKASGGTVESLLSALSDQEAIDVGLPDETFSTVDSAGRDQLLVSAVREDPEIQGGFWIWMVSDNLRRGSALNAVLVAESVLGRIRPILN